MPNIRRALIWSSTLLLLCLLVREVERRGPLTLHAPATLVSNGVAVQRDSEPYFRFLIELKRRLPSSETVALVTPDEAGPVPYLIAVGQLPDQSVLPGSALTWSDARPPEWVACFGRTLDDPRFRIVDSFSGGSLFRRHP